MGVIALRPITTPRPDIRAIARNAGRYCGSAKQWAQVLDSRVWHVRCHSRNH